jgi:hypothetical protein
MRKKGYGKKGSEVGGLQVSKTLVCRDTVQLLWRRVLFVTDCKRIEWLRVIKGSRINQLSSGLLKKQR